jgi:ABC-type glycerol-3-phosphate transport system permease component
MNDRTLSLAESRKPERNSLNPGGSSRSRQILLHVVLLGFAFFSIYPLLFMLSGSIKPVSELTSLPPNLIPERFTVDGYSHLFEKTSFARWFVNSIVVTTLRVLLTLIVAAMAAFSFAAYHFRFRRLLFLMVIGSVLLPFEVIYLPLLKIIIDIGWVNTYQALIVPFIASGFSVFVLHQFMVTIPPSLFEAARADGGSEWQLFRYVAVPVSRPAFGALGIILFLQAWNSFFWPMIVLHDPEKFVLPVGVMSILGSAFHEQQFMTAALAASTLMTIPLIIVFLALQKQFVAGLTRASK